MSNFSNITVAHMAVAMATDNAAQAINGLCLAANHLFPEVPAPEQLRWEATGKPVRHALLMEWLAAEILEAGGLGKEIRDAA